jgi:nitrogen fixation NifU-like protein
MVTGELDPEKDEHHLGKLKMFVGVREFSSRVKCASLSWHSMVGALEKNEEITTE